MARLLMLPRAMAKSKKRANAPVSDPDPSSQHDPRSHAGSSPYDRGRVAERAYERYLARGAAHGSDWEDWLEAERELMNGQPGEPAGTDRERNR